MNDQVIEQEIQAKGLTAPRVTPVDIEANIEGEVYFTAAQGAHGAAIAQAEIERGYYSPPSLGLLTFCVLILRNGFTVTGESACASPENFDAELGRKIARENAVNKLWPLMGYALKESMYVAANQPPAPGAAHAGYSIMVPHQQRVVDEKAELDGKVSKLAHFITSSAAFGSLDPAEQQRLRSQAQAMDSYSLILGERIKAF